MIKIQYLHDVCHTFNTGFLAWHCALGDYGMASCRGFSFYIWYLFGIYRWQLFLTQCLHCTSGFVGSDHNPLVFRKGLEVLVSDCLPGFWTTKHLRCITSMSDLLQCDFNWSHSLFSIGLFIFMVKIFCKRKVLTREDFTNCVSHLMRTPNSLASKWESSASFPGCALQAMEAASCGRRHSILRWQWPRDIWNWLYMYNLQFC